MGGISFACWEEALQRALPGGVARVAPKAAPWALRGAATAVGPVLPWSRACWWLPMLSIPTIPAHTASVALTR